MAYYVLSETKMALSLSLTHRVNRPSGSGCSNSERRTGPGHTMLWMRLTFSPTLKTECPSCFTLIAIYVLGPGFVVFMLQQWVQKRDLERLSQFQGKWLTFFKMRCPEIDLIATKFIIHLPFLAILAPHRMEHPVPMVPTTSKCFPTWNIPCQACFYTGPACVILDRNCLDKGRFPCALFPGKVNVMVVARKGESTRMANIWVKWRSLFQRVHLTKVANNAVYLTTFEQRYLISPFTMWLCLWTWKHFCSGNYCIPG